MKWPVTKSHKFIVECRCGNTPFARPILWTIGSCLYYCLCLKAIVSFTRDAVYIGWLLVRILACTPPIYTYTRDIETWICACANTKLHGGMRHGPYASVGRQGPRGTVSSYCKPVPLSNQTDPAWTNPRFPISYFRTGRGYSSKNI